MKRISVKKLEKMTNRQLSGRRRSLVKTINRTEDFDELVKLDQELAKTDRVIDKKKAQKKKKPRRKKR